MFVEFTWDAQVWAIQRFVLHQPYLQTCSVRVALFVRRMLSCCEHGIVNDTTGIRIICPAGASALRSQYLARISRLLHRISSTLVSPVYRASALASCRICIRYACKQTGWLLHTVRYAVRSKGCVRPRTHLYLKLCIDGYRRKSNYVPFIFSFLQTLAERNRLQPIIDAAIAKRDAAELK